MTANITCEVARREGVLRIPNAALRFKPTLPEGRPSESRSGPPTNTAGSAIAGSAGTGTVAAANTESGRPGDGGPGQGRRPPGMGGGSGRGGPPGMGGGGRSGPPAGGRSSISFQRIWLPPEDPKGAPKPVTVRLGITDGAFTELLGPETVQAGQEIVVGMAESAAAGQNTVNPFAPRFPSPGGGRGGGR